MTTTTTTTTNNDTIDSSNSLSQSCFADIITEMPSPEVFYESYISKRRPVVLQGCCQYVTPRLANVVSSSSLEHLVTIVGHDTIVQVNEFHNNNDKNNSNGSTSSSPRHSRVVDMKFGDFAEKLQEQQCKTSSAECGPSQYYMTTQNLDMNEEGQPALYTSPIAELIQSGHMDSLRPPILGNLVPMTYNLWIGSSISTSTHGSAVPSLSSSSSSGLHHDYHDNLYCLLQGTKTFRLAPPRSIHDLKCKGTLHTLHDNGRIVYQEQVEQGGTGGGMMIRPDGALEKVERIMQVELQKQDVEARLEALNDSNTDDNDEQRKLLEQELDALDEELLDLEMDANNDDKEHEDSDDDDDDDADAGNVAAPVFGANYASDDSLDDNCEPDPKRSKQMKSSSNHEATKNTAGARSTKDDDEDDENVDNDDDVDINDDGVPLNFVLEESDNVQFQTLELKKGDLLYLPAGWFHEVFSRGESDTDNDDKSNDNKKGIHIAFNYWMHPPDVQDDDAPPPATTTGETTTKSTTTTRLSFDKPYKSQFWQRDWDSRGAETKTHSIS
jgi:hypothetical protein